MNSVSLNEKMVLNYPDPLHLLSEEELAEVRFLNDRKGMCFSDPEHHLMISVADQKLDGFSGLILKASDICRNCEPIIAKAMRPYDYELDDFCTEEILGQNADGFSYFYQAEGVRMYGEFYVLKVKKTVYYFYLYMRDKGKEDSVEVWEKFLRGIELKD